MTKRNTNRSEDEEPENQERENARARRNRAADADSTIGLTAAFAPITDDQVEDYSEDEAPIGLTQAFGPVSVDEKPASEGDDWMPNESDWENPWAAPSNESEDSYLDDPWAQEEAEADEQAEQPAAEAPEASEDQTAGQGAAQAQPATQSAAAPASAAAATVQPAAGAARGRHAKPQQPLSAQAQKSHKLRRTLIVIIILVLVLLAALAYFVFHIYTVSQDVAVQQTRQQASSTASLNSGTEGDAKVSTAPTTEVPNLAEVLGLKQDAAIQKLGHGAQVRSTNQLNDEGSAVKTQLTVPLTSEPADMQTGTPTVYLGLDSDGTIVQAGYSTSTSSLGYGALSFKDAVTNEHVVEKTLTAADVPVTEGSATLPADKSVYSTYASDGATLVTERSSFSGDATVNGKACTWSAVLSYDYTTANLTGDLADTVRIIYIYVTQK